MKAPSSARLEITRPRPSRACTVRSVQRRLAGIRVLVTRPRERAEELCFLLEDEGAEVIALPVLELKPPANPRPLQAAAEGAQRYRWVVFASPTAVEAWMEALREAGTLERMGRI